MKVLHLESGRHFYGGAQQVGYLVKGLADLGVQNVLVCRPRSEIAERVTNCDIVELPMHGDCDLLTVMRLRRVLRAKAPDVLHVHSRSGADFFGGIAAHREQIPAVLTRRVDNPEPRIWARSKYRRYAALVGISRHIRAQLVDAAGTASGRVSRISSAVDHLRFRPDEGVRRRIRRELGIDEHELVIGSVGQLIPRKGHDVLLAAMTSVLTHLPNARLLVMGRGPLERQIAKRITELRLSGKARLLGHRDDVAELMQGMDLFVHPARSEGLGVAVLEALSCGLPVVASRVGGLPDLIANGQNGMLVAPNHCAELARAIVALLTDRSKCDSLARNARPSVREHYSIDRMSQRYMGVYQSVVGGRVVGH